MSDRSSRPLSSRAVGLFAVSSFLLGTATAALADTDFPKAEWQVTDESSGGDSGDSKCPLPDAVKWGLDDGGHVRTKAPGKDVKGTYDNPIEFVPVTGLRTRKSATALSQDEQDLLGLGFHLVQFLPDSDPRSMLRVSALHCIYCGGTYKTPEGTSIGDIHRNWYFFPFHRAFLAFMERSMRKLLQDYVAQMPESNPNKAKWTPLLASFALPYWDWTTPRSTVKGDLRVAVPPMYTNTGAATALPNPTDSALAGFIGFQKATTTKGSLFLDVEFWQNTDAALDAFYGTAKNAGKSFSNSHALPHNYAGGWMWHIHHSSRQPLFYAHHGNVDRMWHEWTKKQTSGKPVMPASTTFQNTYFRFPDENGRWVKIKAGTVSKALPGDLGYTY